MAGARFTRLLGGALVVDVADSGTAWFEDETGKDSFDGFTCRCTCTFTSTRTSRSPVHGCVTLPPPVDTAAESLQPVA